MAEYAEILKSAKVLVINTGNVINWNRLRTVNTQSPEQEIVRCLNLTLQYFKENLTNADTERLQKEENVEIHKEDYRDKITEEARSSLQLSVKIFLHNYDASTVKHALDTVLQELQAHYIDSIIITFPDNPPKLDDIKPVWEVLQDYSKQNKLSTLGVSDFSKDSMEMLYQWAEIKPNTDQVNLDSCCVMPQDLVDYAKENDIQLLTHHDPAVLLEDDGLIKCLRAGLSNEGDNSQWRLNWCLRYSALVKSRSIIQSKGYLVAATR